MAPEGYHPRLSGEYESDPSRFNHLNQRVTKAIRGPIMETMTAELQELVDRQKIYHVLTSYCRALDRCDVELMKSVYWEDGYDDHGVFAGNAQEFAEFIIRGIQEWFEVTQHAICWW